MACVANPLNVAPGRMWPKVHYHAHSRAVIFAGNYLGLVPWTAPSARSCIKLHFPRSNDSRKLQMGVSLFQ